MHMVEGGNQLDLFGQQHAVAKHVTRHIAHTGNGEGFFLDVLADFAEVTFDRFPRTACGDAHFLVIIALRATRCEGIVQPEAIITGHTIGDVGEGCSAFVRSNDQIGIIIIKTADTFRRDDVATDNIVGDIKHA